VHDTGSEADDIQENESSREDTLDIASTLDSRINGSVANGTVRTISKSTEGNEEYINKENSSPFVVNYATSFNDVPSNFLTRQNNLASQQPLNSHSLMSMNNTEHTRSYQIISQNATTHDDRFAALQRKNRDFAPLHVECDPVGNFPNNVDFE